MRKIDTEKAIRQIVRTAVESFAQGFEIRHITEVDNPNGTINMKIHNIFIAELGEEIQYYTALVRSFDSSLGNMLEKMAINISKLFYDVNQKVEGVLYQEQISIIAKLLEAYKNPTETKVPQLNDYDQIKNTSIKSQAKHKSHMSDYYLIDKKENIHYLIELKIGGDLDNKKARAEKEALLEQYAILANNLEETAIIRCFFATAYNRFGENKPWKQTRVLQFFSEDELLIGKDFWNFICCSDQGYNIVIDEYRQSVNFIKSALQNIKETYLNG